MIRKHAFSVVYVLDQERAKDFYEQKLGFEVRSDRRMGHFRWLTVGPKEQPDAAIVLMPIAPSPLMTEDDAARLRDLVSRGVLGGGVFETDDCRGTYEQLKSRGVEFVREPKQMPFGLEALMRDDSGNFYSLVERNQGPV